MFKNIIKLLTGTFISRIFGFFREVVVAAYFGTTKVADAFTLALIFPNLFRQILGEDMVERAFMPPFKSIYDSGEKEKAWKFISIISNWFFIILLIVTILLYIIIPIFFSLRNISPKLFKIIFSSQDFDYNLTLELILILLPFMFFIGVASLVGAILNYFEKNWIFSFAPVMLSVGIIIGIYFFEPLIGGYSIAVGYVLGAILQLIIQIPFLFNKHFREEHKLKYHYKALSDKNLDFSIIKRESKIITLNAIFNKSSELFTRFLASSLVSGSTSSIFYAQRIYQLPFGIVSLSIIRAINPSLNKMKSTNNYSDFNKIYNKGLNLTYFLFFGITTLMLISPMEMVDIILRRGKFNYESLRLTSSALICFTFGLLPMSLVSFYTRVLSLFNKNKYALNMSIIGSISSIIFAYLLVKFTNLQHAGIALGSSIAFFINMLTMRKYIKNELPEFVSKNPLARKHNIILLLISIILPTIVYLFNLNYFSTKIISIISLTIKTLIVSIIWGLYYLLFYKKLIRG